MINLEDNKKVRCPQTGNILDHYKDYFDSVYVILNPFFYLNSIKDEQLNFDDLEESEEISKLDSNELSFAAANPNR